MRKISLFAVCPECGAAVRSEACGACNGTAASWISVCEECGGRGSCDPPPLKWSDLRYVSDIREDYNGKEALQA